MTSRGYFISGNNKVIPTLIFTTKRSKCFTERAKKNISHRKKGCLKGGQAHFSYLNHKKKEKHHNNAD